MHSLICSTSPAGNFVANFFSAVFVMYLSCSSLYRVPKWLTDPILNTRNESFLYLYIFYVYSLKKKNKWSQGYQVWSVSCELSIVIGSFHKFCTRYILSLKLNLYYKKRLQAFNVISIVLYHSGPTFGQELYSCQDAFIVDASDYSGHLVRHLLNASEVFPTEWFLQFWE